MVELAIGSSETVGTVRARLRLWSWLLFASLCVCVRSSSAQTDSTIRVDASQVMNHITPYMTGSCIEDVNHEIYGGLYAQLIFGESFEEPPTPVSPLEGWTAYGGNWRLTGDDLHVAADQGAKLINNDTKVANGEVDCDVMLNDRTGGNAAILVRVSEPHSGIDNWNGYEISISAKDRAVAIHRHHHNWHLLKTAAADIPVGRWIHVTVAMKGDTLSVTLGDSQRPAVEFMDIADPLNTGLVGLRTWESDASFRHFTVEQKGGNRSRLTFRAAATAGSGVSGMWDAVHTGSASGRYTWDPVNPLNSAHSQQVKFTDGGSGTIGIANRGLNRWGISLKRGQKFYCSLYLRQKELAGGAVFVSLQSSDGSSTYALKQVTGIGAEWKRFQFTLTSTADDPRGRFVLWLDKPGTLWIDQVTLMPTGADLFHGLPIRADIANALQSEGVTFLRYGGTMVNAPAYKFKNMIGDPDLRPQVKGNWYPYSTNGFAIEEFVRFCRAAHIEPAFAINIDETAQDAADMVEYLNGRANSVWGKKRAENGHSAPYGVRYIEIGNEEALDGNKDWYRRYLARFEALEPAMHAVDPHLKLVIAAWWRADEPLCREIAQKLNGKAALWDVHVGGDGLRDGDDVNREMETMQSLLQKWSPGTSLKACIFEENGGRHDIQRALGHAHILNVTERHGDFVLMDCPANCLQPWLQNDNGWDQGQFFFTPDKAWGMPPYYAQQMAAESYEPLCVQCAVESPNHNLDVTATRSEDGKTLVLKVVNLGGNDHHASIALEGFLNPRPTARTWTLSGTLTDVNTPTDPRHILPVEGTLAASGGKIEVDVKAYSYTVIRLKR